MVPGRQIYLPSYRRTTHKWEADHAPGYDFSFNRNEYQHPAHLRTLDQVLADLADVVSKNGNLLLAIGPEATGAIPAPLVELLTGMGRWLQVNGEAIYGTRPWLVAEGSTDRGTLPTRLTLRKDHSALYVILLANPGPRVVRLDRLTIREGARIQVLGDPPVTVEWSQEGGLVAVALAGHPTLPTAHPLVLKVTPAGAVQPGP